MTLSQSDIDTIIALWKYDEQQADPRAPKDQVVSGLRREDLVSCQYWIKGLSPVCINWDEETEKCTYKPPKGKPYPSGYNGSKCNYLGRRSLCDKYEASTAEDLEKYHCILPNLFLSGTGKKSGHIKTGITLSPIPKNEIKGYCDGNCDGFGKGTGCKSTDPVNDPVICNYFRPWQMGFGALKPKEVKKRITDKGEIYIAPEDIQAAYDGVDGPFENRLPLSFKIYNYRAEFQTCAYWGTEGGSRFVPEDNGGVSLDTQADDPETGCSCTDALCTPYYTLDSPGSGTQAWLLDQVWSQAKTVVCNGAKPECPFYTGEWVYCDDLHMLYGMRVTANQIFELRFWTSLWGSQEEYDKFFESKPNFQDVPTADIYVFDKWEKKGETAADSVALGKILHMCQPAPLNNRRFVPSNFLTVKAIKYTAAGIDIGTTAPTAGQVYYPTLIRDPEFPSPFYPIDIIYPYSSVSPFSAEACSGPEEPMCIKRSSNMDGDRISVIGVTTRDTTMYAFNLTLLDDTLLELEKNWNISTISNTKTVNKDGGNYAGFSPREKFYKRLEAFIENIQKTSPDYIAETSSDSETGYFKFNPIPLKYGVINEIIVCGKFTDTVWDFRKRPVLSKWYGGLIVQNSFSQKDIGKSLPKRFNPSASIEGSIYPLTDSAGLNSKYGIKPSCSLDSFIHSASNTWINQNLETYWKYYYCYKKTTLENATINNWTQIGNSGLIWADIENTDISYLFEWGIKSAKMLYIGPNKDKQIYTNIEMEEVEIESFVSGEMSVPPAACILKPKDSTIKKMFLSGDWELKITYWYTYISSDNSTDDKTEIISPDFSNNNISFSTSGLNINVNDDNKFSIDNVDNETVAVMAIFKEEEGRTVAAMATKLLTRVSMVECRSVEIDYRYQQPTNWYKLLPDTNTSNLAVPPAKEVLQGEYSNRYYRPPCGDHKNGNTGVGKGAVWYPFNNCEDRDFYQAYAGAGFCTNWFPGTPRKDMRYCGPTKYTAFVDPGSSQSYADCILYFHYRYSVTTGESSFVGFANIISYANPIEYTSHNWAMPPFGNKGRDMVIKWLSQDNWTYLSNKNSERPYVTQQWIPLVPDNTDFFMSFNAFSEESPVSPDNFMHVNQLSFFKSELIDDKINTERKRFEDVFGSRGIYLASYPEPLITQGQITKALHYYFKNEGTTWAWREHWEDIEYVGDERNLYFITYDKPDYKYDYEKAEHRYICNENIYLVKYTKPEITEGKLSKYPSLQLGNGPKRYFNIVYDDYNNERVDWKDEGSGNTDGSREEGEENNIYEVTSPTGTGSKWNHSSNCLFDDSAVRTYELAEADGRKIEFLNDEGVIEEYYYNTGIIANLSRDTLKFLPYEEIGYDLPFTVSIGTNDSLGRGVYSWYNVSPTLTVDLSTVEEIICFSEVRIRGFWGVNKIVVDKSVVEYNVCIPGVTIVENYGDGEVRTLSTKDSVKFEEEVYGDIGIVDYTLTFKLQPTVDRMLNKPATSLEIRLDCSYGQYIYLNFVNFKAAFYSNSTEFINVYERRFIESTSTKLGSHNIDGPKVDGNFVLQRDLDYDNSGSYYAISPVFEYVPEDEISVKDKMRAVYASEQFIDDESIDININNISQVEQEEQRDLYNNALEKDTDGDVAIYSFVMPPSLESFFNRHNIQVVINDTLTFRTNKPKWEDNYLHSLYYPGELWYPQGHKYQWGDGVTRKFCYEIDYMPEYGTSGAGRLTILDEPWFLHMDTFDADIPSDPLTALYANRMIYQLEVAQKLFGDEAGFEDAGKIMGTSSSFVDNSNVGDDLWEEYDVTP